MIFLLGWFACALWSMFIWYKDFGGFREKHGLSIGICFLALVGGPIVSLGWTAAYLDGLIKRGNK